MDTEKIDILREKIIEDLEKSNIFFHVKNKFYKLLNSNYKDFFNYIDGFPQITSLDKEHIKNLNIEFVYLDENNLDNVLSGVLENSIFENKLFIKLWK